MLYVLGSESLSGVPLQTVPEGRGVRLGVDQDERDKKSMGLELLSYLLLHALAQDARRRTLGAPRHHRVRLVLIMREHAKYERGRAMRSEPLEARRTAVIAA